ncbi:hypothetical protein CcaCcLH18_10660 [Colletotrichum camelliae]|nr:hypothetical protein CcaCcLH18_10660 [Colletotrichum camelliae]
MEEYAAPINFHPQPSDILIAVMGITGSGKSTFISHCTDQSVSIGEGLHSHTQDIVAYPCKADISANVYLIDTPGFDDTDRDDAEILKQIAAWVGNTYEQKIHIRGIVYLHRITDVRMQGAAIKNLFMFKKLCGKDALPNVILATTMWEEVRENIGQRREEELRATPEYWGEMIRRDSRMVQHHNHYESARNLIHTLLDTTTQTTLAIQKEMVDEKKDLHDTSAGNELDGILTLERERFARDIEQLKQDMAEARELQDKESQEQIRLLQQQRQDEIAKLLQQQESMKVSLEQLHEERFARMESQMEKDRLEIRDLRERLAKSSLMTEPKLTNAMKDLDPTTYSCRQSLSHEDARSLALSPDGCRITSVSPISICTWDIGSGDSLLCMNSRDQTGSEAVRFGYESHSVAYSPDSRRIAVIIGRYERYEPYEWWFEIWDSSTKEILQTSKRYDAPIFSVAYSPDGLRIASVSCDGSVHIFDSNTARCLRTVERRDDIIGCLAYSPDGRCIALGSDDFSTYAVIIIEDRTTRRLRTFNGHRRGVTCIAYSPDGRCIASGSRDNTVKIWEVSTARCLQTFEGHTDGVEGLAYSPDGRCIASASMDKTLKIWDVSTGCCLQTLDGDYATRRCVAYSPDGLHMISMSMHGIIKIWQTNTSI